MFLKTLALEENIQKTKKRSPKTVLEESKHSMVRWNEEYRETKSTERKETNWAALAEGKAASGS